MDSLKILIVEDELLIARSLAQKLKQLNYQVVGIESSGSAALKSVEQNSPDLVLMDIQLKGPMTGIDAAAEIQPYQIPVIYLTAFGDEGTWSQAAPTRPYGYLTKPAKLADLKSAIKVAIARHQEEVHLQTLLTEEQRLNQLRSTYYGMVAHDLRTPLSIVLASAEIIRQYDEQLTAARKQNHFKRIQSAIRQMTQQLESVMVAEQIAIQGLSFSPHVIDVVAFIRDTVEGFKLVSAQGQVLTFTTNQPASYRLLDRNLMEHILNNLISNAIKYSQPETCIDVILSCQPTHLSLTIQDQGIGMPQVFLDKLFELFERADNVGNIKGTGIGLHIVKKAVECHHGDIRVSSEEGKGTSFVINLPGAPVQG